MPFACLQCLLFWKILRCLWEDTISNDFLEMKIITFAAMENRIIDVNSSVWGSMKRNLGELVKRDRRVISGCLCVLS